MSGQLGSGKPCRAGLLWVVPEVVPGTGPCHTDRNRAGRISLDSSGWYQSEYQDPARRESLRPDSPRLALPPALGLETG